MKKGTGRRHKLERNEALGIKNRRTGKMMIRVLSICQMKICGRSRFKNYSVCNFLSSSFWFFVPTILVIPPCLVT